MFRTPAAARSFEAARRDLVDEDVAVRASAARDLAHHAEAHADEVVDALTSALGDESADVRAAAALGLADCADFAEGKQRARQALPTLIGLLDDAHVDVVQMALTALGEIADAGASEAVLAALDDARAAVRFQAVMAYPRICGSRDKALSQLLRATRDDDHLVCHIALRMAEELEGDDDEPVDARFVERAVQLLDHDSDVVAVAAAVVLGRAGRSEGNDVLAAVAMRELGTTEAEDEAAAIELCGQLGLQQTVPALEQRGFGGLLVRDPFAWQSRVALVAMGHPRSVQWVHSELSAWTKERRSLAVAAAGRAGLIAARPQLEAMLGKPGRADQGAVKEALAALDQAEHQERAEP
jgi:HEAT repeat protein